MPKSRRDDVNDLSPEVALAILPLRGFLLWLVIPVGFVAWLAYFRWTRSASLRQCLKWFDLNLVALLQRLLKRSTIEPDVPWVPSRMMPSVTLRSKPNDFRE